MRDIIRVRGRKFRDQAINFADIGKDIVRSGRDGGYIYISITFDELEPHWKWYCKSYNESNTRKMSLPKDKWFLKLLYEANDGIFRDEFRNCHFVNTTFNDNRLQVHWND